jgi:hypothetical protein
MGGTPTLNNSLPPKHRQFSLEDVEDHHLEWLEKRIAEIENGPARHMPRPIQVDTREPGLENRQRRKSLVGSNPTPSANESVRTDTILLRSFPVRLFFLPRC